MSILSSEKQNQIDVKINELLTNTGTSYPDDDLLSIVQKLGVKVVVADLSDIGDDVSGIVMPKEKGADQDTIMINAREDGERRNFTLAHELGHYVLHNGTHLRIDKYNYAVNSQESKEETEANYFAASLLMPKELFLKVFSDSNNIDATARYFGVSNAAARNRYKWLLMNRN